MPPLDWSNPWVPGALAVGGGVLALVGVGFYFLPQRSLRALALLVGVVGGLAAGAGLGVLVLAPRGNAPANPPQAAHPDEPRLSAQEVLERFRQAGAARRLAMVSRLPPDEQGWHTVERRDITQTVVERGAVEAVLCTDLACQVRDRRVENGSFAGVIKSVVDDGTAVKKGQLLLELDDAPLRDQLRQQKAALEKERRALAGAEKARETALAPAEKATADAAVAAARTAVEAEAQRVRGLEEDLTHCKIVAPHDGLMIYYVPEQIRFGGGQPVVAQGEPVRERQKLLRVCDLSKLQVRTRIHEALIARVRVGQAALARVDAFPGRRLRGRVTQVAAVASTQDWLSADVKVYPTAVALDDAAAGLKPGMSAEVTITTERRPGVLRLPVQALLGTVARRSCYVRQGDGIQERQITLGLSEDSFVEVTAGLKEGEQVVGDPRLLAARLAARPGPEARGPASRPGARDVVVQSVRPPADDARRTRVVAYGLTYRDLEQLAALPGVTRAVPVRSVPLELRHRARLHMGRMIATTPAYADAEWPGLAAGRFFTAEEDESMANVAVLGAAAADRLFPDEGPLGQSVTVGGHLLVVVGVLWDRPELEGGPDAKIGGDVYLPLRTYKGRFGDVVTFRLRGTFQREQVELTQVTLTLARAEQVPATMEAARAVLQAGHPNKDWDVLPGVAE